MWRLFLSKLHGKFLKCEANPDSLPGNSNVSAISDGTNQRSTTNGNPTSNKSTVTAKRTGSSVSPSNIVAGIEPLLSFKDVSNADKPKIFLSKLSICCSVFDFSDPNKNSTEKDIKRQTLLDIAEYFHSYLRVTEPMIAASFKMFASNLFRVFPPNCRSKTRASENEEDEPMFDPGWSHLQIVYELLLQLISRPSIDANVLTKYIDHHFLSRLLDLFDSEDPRERDCLKAVLHRLYGKFMNHRPFIRNAMSYIFFCFVFETEHHNGIAELLEVFGSVISGFSLPLKEEHTIFLSRALLPLHKPNTVGVYIQQLTFCVTQFIEKEPKLVSTVIMGLLKYWPSTNSQKEVLFLSELEEILESANAIELQKCMVPFFRRIAYCIKSSHFQVAERALLLWNNDHIMGMTAQNRHVIAPLIVPALEKSSISHWNKTVLHLTMNAKKRFLEMDEKLVTACLKKIEEGERSAMEEMRMIKWEHLEKSASSFRPATGKTAVLVTHFSAPPL